MQKKVEKIYFSVLLALVIIQPILDIMWLNDGTIPEILGFTIPTLVRMMLVAVLGILSFAVIKFNRKYLWFILYAVILGVYFIAHHYNCMNFESLVPGNFNYNVVAEIFYVVRMCIPLAIMYFTYNSKVEQKSFNRVVSIVSLTMSLSIIIANIFKVALGSYTNVRISGNIFDWFFNKGAFTSNELASKGFFHYSITSTVLVLLLPYLLYLFIEKKKISYWLTAFLQAIALFMIGTKATALSAMIVLVLMFIIYLFCLVIKRDYKVNKMVVTGLVIMLGISSIVFSASPAISKMEFDKEYSKERDEEESAGKGYVLSEDDPEGLKAFFKDNYQYMSIKEDFLLTSYPYKYDPVFWYKIYDGLVPSQRMQNRIVEERMLQRVKEIDGRTQNDWLGIGYTRTSSIYNLEKDFIYQYYSMGILGAILLVGPYILIILLMMIVMLWKFKKKCTLLNCSLMLGLGLSCFLAYYSGNTLESLGITIVLGFVVGYMLKINFQKERMVEIGEDK